MAIQATLREFIPKVRGIPIVVNIERILQPVTDFIRGNPIVSTAIVGAGTTGLVAAVAAVKRARAAPRKRPKKAKRKKAPKKKKAKKRKIKRRRKGIIRGPGLGSREIKHSGKSTKGKFKLVSFRDKKTGKMVRFKARR